MSRFPALTDGLLDITPSGALAITIVLVVTFTGIIVSSALFVRLSPAKRRDLIALVAAILSLRRD